MYTRCPACKTAYRIGPEQLRAGRGEVKCQNCHAVFNALSSLADTVKDSSKPGAVPEAEAPVLGARDSVALPSFARERLEELDSAWAAEAGEDAAMTEADRGRFQRRSRSMESIEFWRWSGAALGLLLLLGVQVLGFERARLAQNSQLRPALDGLCAALGCELPPFKDVDGIEILSRALLADRDNKDALEFRLVLANRSGLPQGFPDLRLVLNALDGQPVAERVFSPLEYLGEWPDDIVMPVGKSFEARLVLYKPGRDIGGFNIEFQ
jgi:predicted Zn finger-like uncharacterized protein